MYNLLRDERGQTTVEWGVLSIMIAIGLIVIGMAFQNGMTDVLNTLFQKVVDLINSISI
jgi:Flp pilus assembly pilin Flp